MAQGEISKNARVIRLVRAADSFVARGDFAGAADRLREALKIEPRNATLLQIAARWEESQHNYEIAERHLRTAIRLRPKKWDLYFDFGSFLLRDHRVPEALKAYRQSHLCGAPTSRPLIQIARLMEHSRDTREAERALQLALARWPDDPATRVQLAAVLLRNGDFRESERLLRGVIDECIAEKSVLITAYHTLGSVLDKQDRIDEAWQALMHGKACYDSTLSPNQESMISRARANTRGLTYEIGRKWASREHGAVTIRHALLAGFPRSGTTLLEVVLGSHPEVRTLEETDFLERLNCDLCPQSGPDMSIPAHLHTIPDEQRLELCARYDRWTTRLLRTDSGGTVLIDKHPMYTPMAPFFTWLFPGARVIVPLRDPRDIIVSNYFQEMHHPDLSSLERIADLYAAIMQGWLGIREMIGDVGMEIRYEDVVEDLESAARRLLDHLDLAWDPDLLLFHERAKHMYVGSPSYEAVSRPLNPRAIGRWHRYEKQLDPIMSRLQPFIDAFGYTDG